MSSNGPPGGPPIDQPKLRSIAPEFIPFDRDSCFSFEFGHEWIDKMLPGKLHEQSYKNHAMLKLDQWMTFVDPKLKALFKTRVAHSTHSIEQVVSYLYQLLHFRFQLLPMLKILNDNKIKIYMIDNDDVKIMMCTRRRKDYWTLKPIQTRMGTRYHLASEVQTMKRQAIIQQIEESVTNVPSEHFLPKAIAQIIGCYLWG